MPEQILYKQDVVTETVKQWILSGKYRRGEKLPNNRDLASLFKMNARTVCAGLNKLVEEGLIECTPRRGTVVMGSSAIPSGNSVPLLIFREGDFYGDLARFTDQRLAENGLFPVISGFDILNREEEIVSFLNRVLSKQRPYGFLIEGFTCIPYEWISARPEVFSNTVFLFTYHGRDRIPFCRYVLTDYRDMGRQAADYFASHGKKHILFPAVPELHYTGPWSSIQTMIMEGLSERARELGMFFDEVLFHRRIHGHLPIEQVLPEAFRNGEPDAVFAWNDGYLSDKVLPVLRKLGKENILKLGARNTPRAVKHGFASFDMHQERTMSIALGMLTGTDPRRDVLIKPTIVEHEKGK